MNDYVELHCHSCYSLQDGASTPEALLDRAVELGLPALALTDHDALYGAPRFVAAAQARRIKPIIGSELTLDDGRRLLLLTETPAGYANLCWLISRAQMGQSKGYARLPLALLEGRTGGLIALAGGREGLLSASPADALDRLVALFPAGALYVELQHHLQAADGAINAGLADLAAQRRLPLVATNDVHYARRADSRLHDLLTALRHHTSLAEAGRLLRPNSEYHLKSGPQMARLLRRYPQAIVHSAEIAARCQVGLDFRGVSMPAPPLAAGQSAAARLRLLCEEGLAARYPEDAAAARRQMGHELDVIERVGLTDYFLLVWDIMRFARERGIRAQGRGSAANSIVAYLLGITRVDPLAHHLLFERFLSDEARVMPDIDVDFCSKRREEVIQYVYEKYGEAHVGMVCNHVTYQPRSAARDVGKALGLPASAIDQIAKGLGRWGTRDIDAAVAGALDAPDGVSGRAWQQFLALWGEIQGLPRHLGIHVGGMVITRRPLDEIVPLEQATMPGRVVIQWDKEGVEDAGLIKTDILSLRTLTAVDECLHMIEQGRGRPLDLDAIPLDDPAVYRALQRADTIGAFQVESRAQQQALVQMRPANLADIVIEVALIRPGPLQGGMVHPFLRRRQKLEPVTYLHPLLRPILAETLGVVVFQEQVIRIAMAMGQFSPGEADMLRRAMSRRRSDEAMAGFRQRFLAGAAAQGVAAETAETIFDKLSGFASYGFCKSHAAAFARLAYETMYLRAHYPAEYYCALFNNQPMGFYPPRVLAGDARRHGVNILPMHINRSLGPCSVESGSLRLGLHYADGLGESGAARIVAERGVGGYRHLTDFCRRARLPRRLVENLILAGAMDEWGTHRRQLLWELGRVQYVEEGFEELEMPADIAPIEPLSAAEAMVEEYAVTGLSAGGQLLELLRASLSAQGVLSSGELEAARNGQIVTVAGQVVVRQSPGTAKGFVFLTLEDECGLINLIVRPDVFQSQRAVWARSPLLLAQGVVQRARDRIDILADRAQTLSL